MILRQAIICLTTALPIFIVAFAVFMGAYVLTSATGDGVGAQIVWWVAMFDLMFLLIDLLLLIFVMALILLNDGKSEQRSDANSES